MPNIWLVRAVRWYPRKPVPEDAVWVSRPDVRVSHRWEDDGFGNIVVPVEADSAAAAESKVAALDVVERLRDKPTTKMDVA